MVKEIHLEKFSVHGASSLHVVLATLLDIFFRYVIVRG